MDNLLPYFSDFPISLLTKGVLLLIIALFLFFLFLAYVQIRALNRLVTISARGESSIVQIVALVYLLLVASLFLFALVIL